MLNKSISLLFKTGIIFSIVSFLSVMLHLLLRKGVEQPTANIGFPLKFYEQFWAGENDLHWGWNIKHFLIDGILILIVVLIFDQFKSKKL
ncbi:hypothetical protein [Flavobacterium sp. N1719]|uniref:hypothetical protein n=1 Tax=Flavobacterium sp. N1719 TaxID=2885633 RepID=UPI0022231453|nr:hypothetical protein [Flavobacterium sp. N1719]